MTKSYMKTKKVKAWAVVADGDLRAFGNGEQWQFPIFYLKGDAIDFHKKNRLGKMTDCKFLIVPCTITYQLPKPTNKK